jgi:hypothetical protein
VCKTSERDLRESLEEIVGSRFGTIFKRDSAQIPGRNFCLEVAEIYCCEGGRTVWIRTIHTAKKWACFSRQVRHRNQGSLRVFAVEERPYRADRTAADWHGIRGADLEQAVQQYGFLGTVF